MTKKKPSKSKSLVLLTPRLGDDLFSTQHQDVKKVLLMAGIPADLSSVTRVTLPPNNQIMLISIGNLKQGILPSIQDLDRMCRRTLVESHRFMRNSATVATRVCPTLWVFFPPILELEVTGSFRRPLVLATLGSSEYNIRPSRKDLKALVTMLGPALKQMGTAVRAISV